MVEESLSRLLAKPAPAFVDLILRHEETFIDPNCTYANAQKWPSLYSSSLVISGSVKLEVKIYPLHSSFTKGILTVPFPKRWSDKTTSKLGSWYIIKITKDLKLWLPSFISSSLLVHLISQTLPHYLWISFLFFPMCFLLKKKIVSSASCIVQNS